MKKLALVALLILPITAFAGQQCHHYTDAQLESMSVHQLITLHDDDYLPKMKVKGDQCDLEMDRAFTIINARSMAAVKKIVDNLVNNQYLLRQKDNHIDYLEVQ